VLYGLLQESGNSDDLLAAEKISNAKRTHAKKPFAENKTTTVQ
jgi:hypothetical protein